MPKKIAAVEKPTAQNRVWIELEKPRDKVHADQISALANNLLQRITPGTDYKFFYSENKAMFCYGHITFEYLSDRGKWFNLDFVGRPLDVPAEQWERAT